MELDKKREAVGLEDEEIQSRKSKFVELWRLLKARDVMFAQRSRLKWLKDGDENSKFFHNSVKGRSGRNVMRALKVGEGWAQSPVEVRREVVDFFTRHTASSHEVRLRIDGVPFNTLSEEQNLSLVAPFELREIEEVVKECDGDKSPRQDGFNFNFIKEFWYLLKNEIRILFDQFHANEVVPKSLLAYFVALIPRCLINFK